MEEDNHNEENENQNEEEEEEDDDEEEEYPLVRMVQCGVHSITTTVTAAAAEASKWIEETINRSRPAASSSFSLHNAPIVVGMGVQWGRNGAATLQLCVRRRCLIFQIFRADGCPENLRRFMVDPNIFFVGMWSYMDQAMLRESRQRLVVKRPMDVRLMVESETGRGRYLTAAELAEFIVGESGMLGNELVALGNWELLELGVFQVEYACHDAYLSYVIGKEMITNIFRRRGGFDILTSRTRIN